MATLATALLVVLGISMCNPVGAQTPSSNAMYVKMLEAMVRRLGGQLPTRPAAASPAASASPAVQCGAPPGVARASTSYSSRQAGAQARHACDIGYGPGEATRVCQPNGQWSPISLVCNPVDCGMPITMVGGVATYTSTTYGSSSTYKCKGGYSNVGGTTVAVCQEDGQWSKPSLTCAPTSAPNVEKLRTLLSTFQNSPLASRLSPELRARLSKSQQALNRYTVPAPAPTRPANTVPSTSSSQGQLPPHMMAMLNSMKASMPPAMKAMLANAVPTETAPPTQKPAAPQPKNQMQNMQNMMNTMQQMQMMRMLMSQKAGGSAGKGGAGGAALDPEAIAEAAADSMQRNLMMGMAAGMMPNAMSNPLAALLGNNPMMGNNQMMAFPVSAPGVSATRDPFLFEVPAPTRPTGLANQQSQGQSQNGMNPMLMAALLGNGFMGMFGGSA